MRARRNRFILVAISAIVTFVTLQSFVGRERIFGSKFGWHNGHRHNESWHQDRHQHDDEDRPGPASRDSID